MDESRKPDDSASVKNPWQNDEAPGGDLGATGVFGAVPQTSGDTHAGSGMKDDEDGRPGERALGQDAAQVSVPHGREGLQEPIVHKVAIGGGSATRAVDLLGLLRNSAPAAEVGPGSELEAPRREPLTVAFQTAPASPAGMPPGQSIEGFTQLLRALSGDSSPASAVERSGTVPRATESGGSAEGSGFTSLIRTLNPGDRRDGPEMPLKPTVSTPDPVPSDGVGGFTALLQGFSGSGPNYGERPLNPRPQYENPVAASPASPFTPPASVAGQAGPGAFTQLFNALGTQVMNPVTAQSTAMSSRSIEAPPMDLAHSPASRPSGDEASFTQLISAIGQPTSGASTYRDDPKSGQEDFSSRPSSGREDRFALNQTPTGIPAWSSPAASRPQPEYSSESGGLTQLLRMLNEPAKGSDIPVAYPPAGETPALSQAGGSLFTQTYRKLDDPGEPVAPTPAPTYSPPSRPAAQPNRPALTEGFLVDSGTSNPMVPNLSAGPSDVTRILDASKLREMLRPGASMAPPTSSPPAAAQQQSAIPQPPATPQFQWPSQAPPSPAPWQPPPYAPPTATPQIPVMAAPLPAPAAPPAMGKMQQYLPLLLIIIIFLLVAILVTVVFLVKH